MSRLGTYRVCSEPGCGQVVMAEAGRCERHRKAQRKRADARRPSATDRGYNSAVWRKTRAMFLHFFPTCLDCGEPATVADHAPLTRDELVRRGVADPDAWGWLRPRCESCHNRKTATQDGGFGR